MKKQSSIEWLQECLNLHLTHKQQMQFEGLFQQAKEMHKQEILDATLYGWRHATLYGWRRSTEVNSMHPNEYYENTYEKTR